MLKILLKELALKQVTDVRMCVSLSQNHMQIVATGSSVGVYCASLTYGGMRQWRPKGTGVVRGSHEKEESAG